MKKSMNGNMYEVTLDETWDLFGSYLDGAHAALVLVVSEQPMDTQSRGALSSSAKTFGYGRNACTFATLNSNDNAASKPDDDAPLDNHALFLMIEGLDPLCLVLADAASAAACASAYHCEVPLESQSRVFGRTAVAFKSFQTMISDAQDKQVAWALLKKLPKFGGR